MLLEVVAASEGFVDSGHRQHFGYRGINLLRQVVVGDDS